jgi:hypothetical protein
MTLYVIVLRLLHIVGGVFWVGAAWMIAGFLFPTANAAPEGPKFLQRLFQSRLPAVISAAAGLNILAGLLLYWRDSGGLRLDWIMTRAGLGFTLGSVAAIAAFVIGVAVSKPAADKLGALGKEIAAGGQPPTPEQAAAMQALAKRTADAATWVAALLAISLIAMSIARYL